MDATQAGQRMKWFRIRKGLTPEQASQHATLPGPDHLAALEQGQSDIRTSEYFERLVQLYDLSGEELTELNPDALIHAAESSNTSAHTNTEASGGSARRPSMASPLPSGLVEASKQFGESYPSLMNPAVLRQLAAVQHWDGGPQTAQEWLDLYLDNRNRFR